MSQSDSLSSPGAPHDPLGTVQVNELDHERDGGDWITRLLSSGFFRHLPPENSQRLFAELQRLPVRAGEIVAEQGAPGDYLYIVTHGRCAVTRRAPGSQRELKLTVLQDGDTFGEGALISGAPRTTTVRMLSDGALMRLRRESFVRLVLAPTLKFLSYQDASRLIDAGSVWLDVRPQAERTDHIFDGSISIPSQLLPLKVRSLDRKRSYVIYCESGGYSAASCFYLMRMGLDAYVLEGGLEGICPGARAGPAPAIVAVPACVEQRSALGSRDTSAPDAGPEPTLQLADSRQQAGPLEVVSEHNEALMRLIELHHARHYALVRQLDEVRRDAAQELEREQQRLARRYKKMRRKFRAVRSQDAAVRTDLEQQCDRLTRALEGAHEDLRRANATAHGLYSERCRLGAQLVEARTRIMGLLSDNDVAVDTSRQAASALEVVLEAVQVQNDGICALREEFVNSRSR